jgi:hypothetical protein
MAKVEEWLLGFASAATTLLEGYFIRADREGLLFARGPFHFETLNISSGCIVSVHYPLVELIVLGVTLTGAYRGLNRILNAIRHRQ